ncbi:MAG TPA: hypothetical protein VFE79_13200 [Paraburkholderia sp.]|nr:hypothetical protein [Paraburkholderia sp.]
MVAALSGVAAFAAFVCVAQAATPLPSAFAPQSQAPQLLPDVFFDGKSYQIRTSLTGEALMPDVTLDLGARIDSASDFLNRSYAGSTTAGESSLTSAIATPYATLADGGTFVGATVKVADDLHFGVTQSVLTPQSDRFSPSAYTMMSELTQSSPFAGRREVSSTIASLNWDPTRWAGIGLTASQASERHGVLGNLNTPALAVADGGRTSAAGVTAHVDFGKGWVTTASYSEGITQLDLTPAQGLMTTATDLRSRAYGISVAKRGLFGRNDSLDIALSRPVQVYSGSANLVTTPILDGKAAALNYGLQNLSLATRTPETDVELGYVTTFFDGALALQTNAAYQMNTRGQSGTNALAVVSRAKLNF